MTDTANTEAARMGSTRAARPAALRRRSRTRIVLPAVASAAVVSAALASVTLSQPARPAAQQSPSLDSIAQAQAQGYSAVLVTGEDTGVEAEAAPGGREEETVVVTITTPEPTPSQTPSEQDSAPSQPSDSGSSEASTSSSSSSGSAPSGGATHYPVGELQEYAAQQAAANYGWGSDQMSCLIQLWERESNWNPNAHNASSGAHGIPQALPGSKMGPGWESDPHVQINWGLGYIAGRYGTPCGAWGHSESVGWY